MKKQIKKKLLELTELLSEAHDDIQKKLEKNDVNTAATVLEECQNLAITIGTKIEEIEGNGTTVVKALEDYCELVYQIHEKILQPPGTANPRKIYKSLNKSYIEISNRIKYDIPEIKEVVFLPYMASLWDSLESVWKRAMADPEIEAKVIPIPYFDKNSDGSFGEMHYEGTLFPDYVPVLHYDDYNFEKNHPDEIYIHNPYDDMNIVTSVHPFFYSKNIKQFTDKLIYIPYFVLEEIDLSNKKAVENKAHFAQVPAVIHADEVIVQSENMRQFYIECIVQLTGENTRKVFEKKIKGTGSPKIEKLQSMTIDDISIPEEWNKYIYKEDGSRKKIVLYNNSISALLRESEQILAKMDKVFDEFSKYRDSVTLLWRPHPLIKATINSMRPQLQDAYNALIMKFKNGDIGIYDDSADVDRAIIVADAYYGDGSSLVTLCKSVKMPIMVQKTSV